VLLHFGAVDQLCEVFVNGKSAGTNLGGYYAFSFDITDLIREENEIVVKVRDYTDTRSYETGKQRLKPGRIWYTSQSGIWQTVWIESVPEPICAR
jgi:Glycosyl hydrolases family 2, sugar binding domain.